MKRVLNAPIDFEVGDIALHLEPLLARFFSYLALSPFTPISLLSVQVYDKEDFSEELVIQKLRASGGAHQPTSYEFSNYSA